MSVVASPSRVRPLVRARSLSVRIGGVPVLEQVDLDVAPGELLVVSGEPGSGKTTLLRCVAGDISATGGSVWVYGANPSDGRPEDAVAMVWQDRDARLAGAPPVDRPLRLSAGQAPAGSHRRGRVRENVRQHVHARAPVDPGAADPVGDLPGARGRARPR
jgi:ABC-type sugar transport system ATPase subunit